MTPEQRINQITSILSLGVMRLVAEQKKKEAISAHAALVDLINPEPRA